MSESERAEKLKEIQLELFQIKREYATKRAELLSKFVLIQGGAQKECRKCREVMSTDQFPPDIGNRDGRYSYCYECKSAIDRARYVARKSNVKARGVAA